MSETIMAYETSLNLLLSQNYSEDLLSHVCSLKSLHSMVSKSSSHGTYYYKEDENVIFIQGSPCIKDLKVNTLRDGVSFEINDGLDINYENDQNLSILFEKFMFSVKLLKNTKCIIGGAVGDFAINVASVCEHVEFKDDNINVKLSTQCPGILATQICDTLGIETTLQLFKQEKVHVNKLFPLRLNKI